ncbi:MAG: nuclear transport factor 2 family protein [Pseudomonadota bacterium]
MSESEQNKSLVAQFFDILNRNDIAAMLDLYAEDARVTTMGSTLISGTFGKDKVAAAASGALDVFPEGLKFEVLDVVAEGDGVAVEAESRGEHVSGKTYNNLYHFKFRFRDGKLLELKEYMDTEHVTDVLCGGQRPPFHD